MDWELRLIKLYEFICKLYREHLWVYCQRFSPYTDLTFTNEEVICIFLWGVMDKRRELKDIHKDTRRHLQGWYPHLPSYTGYVQRLNPVAGVFVPLLEALQESFPDPHALQDIRLMDALPIHLAHAKRSGRARVAGELANKGYADDLLAQAAQTNQELALLTPIKKAKGQAYLDAAAQLWSTAVSRVRQPIESLFNWIEEKTGIQRASKVRSSNGFLVHVFGRPVAAMWLLAHPQCS